MKFLIFLCIFLYGSYQIWLKIPYLLTTSPYEIQHQINKRTNEIITDTLELVKSKIKGNNCLAIKGKYQIIMYNNGIKYKDNILGYWCNPNKCYSIVSMEQNILNLNFTGQQCTM